MCFLLAPGLKSKKTYRLIADDFVDKVFSNSKEEVIHIANKHQEGDNEDSIYGHSAKWKIAYQYKPSLITPLFSQIVLKGQHFQIKTRTH